MKDKFPEQVLKVILYDLCDGGPIKKLCFYYNDAYPKEKILFGESIDTPRTTSRKTFMETLDYILTSRDCVLLSITTTVVYPNGNRRTDFGNIKRQRKAVLNYLTKHNYKIQPTDVEWLLHLSKKDVGEIVLEEV